MVFLRQIERFLFNNLPAFIRSLLRKVFSQSRRLTRKLPLVRYFIETCVVLLRRGPVVTVFGSCRQDSVQHYFAVTPIRDGITYPHFTGEILQAIEYCSRPYGPRPPQLAFRNAQLGKKVLPRWLAFVSFLRTDVFVVEVASALSYGNGDWYFHHEIHDNLANVQQRQANSIDPAMLNGIRPELMDRSAIRNDLQKIASLLGPKRLLFVTHFSTRPGGKRTELAQEVESFGSEIGVAVVNPSSFLDRWTAEELFVDEPTLSHYTSLGHSIVGGHYRDRIIALASAESGRRRARPPLVQVVDNSAEKVARQTFHGWGDSVLGAAFVFQEARRQRRLAAINWDSFSAARWLDLGPRQQPGADGSSPADSADVCYLFHGSDLRRFAKFDHVFTNIRPSLPLDGATRDFLKMSGVRPGPEVNVSIDTFLSDNRLEAREFVVLHVRLGDEISKAVDAAETLTAVVRLCRDELQTVYGETLPVVVMSDSFVEARSPIEDRFVFRSAQPGHLGLPGGEASEKDGLVDFFLMGLALKIYSASVYKWGSGFSLAASQLFDVPLLPLRRLALDGQGPV